MNKKLPFFMLMMLFIKSCATLVHAQAPTARVGEGNSMLTESSLAKFPPVYYPLPDTITLDPITETKVDIIISVPQLVERSQTLMDLTYREAFQGYSPSRDRIEFDAEFNAGGKRITFHASITGISSIPPNQPQIMLLEQTLDGFLYKLSMGFAVREITVQIPVSGTTLKKNVRILGYFLWARYAEKRKL